MFTSASALLLMAAAALLASAQLVPEGTEPYQLGIDFVRIGPTGPDRACTHGSTRHHASREWCLEGAEWAEGDDVPKAPPEEPDPAARTYAERAARWGLVFGITEQMLRDMWDVCSPSP